MRYVNRILEETEPIAMRSLIRVSASSVLLSASRGEKPLNKWLLMSQEQEKAQEWGAPRTARGEAGRD